MILPCCLRATAPPNEGDSGDNPIGDENQFETASREDYVLEGFRDYLLVMARMHVKPPLLGKVDPSGVVQQTLLDAHQASDRLRTDNVHELTGWLRKTLAANLADAVRWYFAAKRDARRERSLQDALCDCSAPLDGWVAAEQSSPSGRLMREEELLRVGRVLQQLPEDQRIVLELHYLEGQSLKELSERLGVSSQAVAGLLYRGMKKLRARLGVEN